MGLTVLRSSPNVSSRPPTHKPTYQAMYYKHMTDIFSELLRMASAKTGRPIHELKSEMEIRAQSRSRMKKWLASVQGVADKLAKWMADVFEDKGVGLRDASSRSKGGAGDRGVPSCPSLAGIVRQPQSDYILAAMGKEAPASASLVHKLSSKSFDKKRAGENETEAKYDKRREKLREKHWKAHWRRVDALGYCTAWDSESVKWADFEVVTSARARILSTLESCVERCKTAPLLRMGTDDIVDAGCVESAEGASDFLQDFCKKVKASAMMKRRSSRAPAASLRGSTQQEVDLVVLSSLRAALKAVKMASYAATGGEDAATDGEETGAGASAQAQPFVASIRDAEKALQKAVGKVSAAVPDSGDRKEAGSDSASASPMSAGEDSLAAFVDNELLPVWNAHDVRLYNMSNVSSLQDRVSPLMGGGRARLPRAGFDALRQLNDEGYVILALPVQFPAPVVNAVFDVTEQGWDNGSSPGKGKEKVAVANETCNDHDTSLPNQVPLDEHAPRLSSVVKAIAETTARFWGIQAKDAKQYTWREPVVLRSRPGNADQMQHTDCAHGGSQARLDIGDDRVDIVILFAVMEGTRVVVEGVEREIAVGECIVLRGDVYQGGAPYAEEHLCIHVYGDADNSARVANKTYSRNGSGYSCAKCLSFHSTYATLKKCCSE